MTSRTDFSGTHPPPATRRQRSGKRRRRPRNRRQPRAGETEGGAQGCRCKTERCPRLSRRNRRRRPRLSRRNRRRRPRLSRRNRRRRPRLSRRPSCKPAARSKSRPRNPRPRRCKPRLGRCQSFPTVALDAGGYATAGFITSPSPPRLYYPSAACGRPRTKQPPQRRRAERQARLAQDKLKQKDRWTAAIDTDVVSAEVAERAAKIAEEPATPRRRRRPNQKRSRRSPSRATPNFYAP